MKLNFILQSIFLTMTLFCNITIAQTQVSTNKFGDNIIIKVSKTAPQKGKLEVEFSLTNNENQSLIVLVPSQRSSNLNDHLIIQNGDLLEFRRYFYSTSPEVLIEGDNFCVSLKKVEIGETYNEKIVLDYPIVQAPFPFQKKLNLLESKRFKLMIGVLAFDKEIIEIPKQKPFGDCVNGKETLEKENKGTSLIQLQTVLSSSEIML